MEIGDITRDELLSWVPFREDAEVLMKYVTREELARLKRKSTRREFRRGQFMEQVDLLDFSVRIGRAAVRNWRNITVGGEPFEFSEENRDLLMRRSYEFSDFVQEKCIEISTFMMEKEEKSKKKSGPMSGGV